MTPASESSVGRRIAAARLAVGLSQSALAATVSLDRTAVSKIESGKRRVDSGEIARIASALGRPVAWFLEGALRPAPLKVLRSKRAAIMKLARKHGARSIRVFGSVARGDSGPTSDVDLLVDMEPGRGLFDQGGLLLDLQDLLGLEVDIVTPEGLRDRIRDRVLSEAVPL